MNNNTSPPRPIKSFPVQQELIIKDQTG